MFKVSMFFIFALLVTGCASGSVNTPPHTAQVTATKPDPKKLIKYTSNQGCHMLSNGYMVCPKVR